MGVCSHQALLKLTLAIAPWGQLQGKANLCRFQASDLSHCRAVSVGLEIWVEHLLEVSCPRVDLGSRWAVLFVLPTAISSLDFKHYLLISCALGLLGTGV